MLQQTQVDRVLPKYAEWLEKYPSLHALASAPEHDVAQTWRPLGYNIRPKRLQSIAREAVAHYDELLREMKLALQECGRKLGSHLRARERALGEQKRLSLFQRYIPEVAQAMSEILGSDKEKIEKSFYKALPNFVKVEGEDDGGSTPPPPPDSSGGATAPEEKKKAAPKSKKPAKPEKAALPSKKKKKQKRGEQLSLLQ